MTIGSPQPGIDSPMDLAGPLPPVSRGALAATVAAAVVMLAAVTVGAVLLNHDPVAATGDRVAATGFSFAPPPGWQDDAGGVAGVRGGQVVRTYLGPGQADARSVIVVAAGRPRPAVPDGDQAPGGALERAMTDAARAAGTTVLGSPRRITLGGAPALALDVGVASGRQGSASGLRVAAARGGTVYSASLLAPAARYGQDAAAFEAMLAGWTWTAG